MCMRVVSYTLSMYFLPDQYPRPEDKQVVSVAATSIRYAVPSENKLTEGLSICWNQKQVLQMGLT